MQTRVDMARVGPEMPEDSLNLAEESKVHVEGVDEPFFFDINKMGTILSLKNLVLFFDIFIATHISKWNGCPSRSQRFNYPKMQ
jgi:hypothetical protein